MKMSEIRRRWRRFWCKLVHTGTKTEKIHPQVYRKRCLECGEVYLFKRRQET